MLEKIMKSQVTYCLLVVIPASIFVLCPPSGMGDGMSVVEKIRTVLFVSVVLLFVGGTIYRIAKIIFYAKPKQRLVGFTIAGACLLTSWVLGRINPNHLVSDGAFHDALLVSGGAVLIFIFVGTLFALLFICWEILKSPRIIFGPAVVLFFTLGGYLLVKNVYTSATKPPLYRSYTFVGGFEQYCRVPNSFNTSEMLDDCMSPNDFFYSKSTHSNERHEGYPARLVTKQSRLTWRKGDYRPHRDDG